MGTKVIDIIKLWEGQNPNATDLQKEIAESRANTCDGCDKLRFNQGVGFFYCGECGCPLGNKIFNPQKLGLCPLDKWEK